MEKKIKIALILSLLLSGNTVIAHEKEKVVKNEILPISNTSQITIGPFFGPIFYSDKWRALGGGEIGYVRNTKWYYGLSFELQRYPTVKMGGFPSELVLVDCEAQENIGILKIEKSIELIKHIYAYLGIGMGPGLWSLTGHSVAMSREETGPKYFARVLPLIGITCCIPRTTVTIGFEYRYNYNLWYTEDHNRYFSMLGMLCFDLLDKNGMSKKKGGTYE